MIREIRVNRIPSSLMDGNALMDFNFWLIVIETNGIALAKN